jgi:hypothetical protein
MRLGQEASRPDIRHPDLDGPQTLAPEALTVSPDGRLMVDFVALGRALTKISGSEAGNGSEAGKPYVKSTMTAKKKMNAEFTVRFDGEFRNRLIVLGFDRQF